MQATTCKLHSTLEDLWGELGKFESQTILTVNLCDDATRSTIGCIFDKVAKSHNGKRNEATGASKILHLIYPELFVMWDGAIRGGYGSGGKYEGVQYVDFLRRMQMLANYAIEQVKRECDVSRDVAIERLQCDGHTLAKTLDEYNYVKFTLNEDSVWQAEYEPCSSLQDRSWTLPQLYLASRSPPC